MEVGQAYPMVERMIEGKSPLVERIAAQIKRIHDLIHDEFPSKKCPHCEAK